MPGRFDDPEAGSAFYPRGDRRLLVLFGSRLGGLVPGQTPWGFVRSSSDVDASHLFLRDHLRRWYTSGVREFPSMTELGALIALLAAGHRETVLFGASMGGWAALLFARSLGLDAIVVNPQTFLDPERRLAAGDDRWEDDIAAIPYSFTDDIRELGFAGTARIIYSADAPLDVIHATRLGEDPGIVLDPRPGADHALARELARTGELQRLLAGG